MASPLRTIYMTRKQDDQLRSAIKSRQERCEEVQDTARKSRDPKDLLAEATSASLLADMAAATGTQKCESDRMPALEVGCTYLPSVRKFKELVPMNLSDLQLHVHHQGRSLKIRRIGPVVLRRTGSWTIVQDLEDMRDAERLEIILHDQHQDQRALEMGQDFVLKEPFFTLGDSGEPTLRIDHPSDLVRLRSDPMKVDRKRLCEPRSPEMYKTGGNTALRQNDLAKAHSYYTQGLEIALEAGIMHESIINDLYRNRCHADLLLNRFDQAISDATSSLTFKADGKHKELNGKAYFRAGYAAYRLGEWQRAKGFFTEQQELTPHDKDARLYLRNIEARLGEQAGGGYQFHRMKSALSRQRPRVDAANYDGNTAIKQTTQYGRGLFATKDIAKDDLIMCEKAFCVVWSHEDAACTTMTYDNRDERVRAFPAGLAQALVQKLRSNPSLVGKVQALYGDHKGVGESLVTSDDGSAVIDIFQIHDIICRNAFSPGSQFGEEDVRKGSTGLWIRASYMNHSCVPNTEREFIGDLMVVRATKPIKAGDEITHIYDDSRDVDARAESLMRTWGFKCSCPRCIAERGDGSVLRKERQALEDKMNTFVANESPKLASMLLIRRAEGLVKAIEATYDEQRYEGVPRMALSNINNWLSTARSKTKKPVSRLSS